MNKIALVSRILMGLGFVVFGLNGFFQFLPQPPLPEGSMKFLGGLMAAPYFFPLLKGTEVLMGLLLLANRLVPFALVVLSPIVIHIFLFHAFLAPDGMIVPILFVVMQILIAYDRRESFAGLFK